MPLRKVIISGGGTGGHIFPAIAIANALKKMNANIEILFVGAKGKMEMEKVPAAGFRIEGLNISGLYRGKSFSSLLKNLKFPFRLLGSLRTARKILRKFKPDAVIGVGGYASGPVLYAAQQKKIPTVIQEQNSYAGITNKLLGKKADKICVAYSGMEKFFPEEKIIITGNPVRQDILNLEGKRARGIEHFQLDENKNTLLIIGGSLGARSINKSIMSCLEKLEKSGFQVLWQTGKLFYPEAEKATKELKNVRAHEFISKMDYAYAVADAVVSRAGASSIAELCIVGKPAILVPFPYAAEDHQTKNAMALVSHHAAILIRDSESGDKLCGEIMELMKDENKRQKLATNIAPMAMRDADKAIANEIARLVKKKE